MQPHKSIIHRQRASFFTTLIQMFRRIGLKMTRPAGPSKTNGVTNSWGRSKLGLPATHRHARTRCKKKNCKTAKTDSSAFVGWRLATYISNTTLSDRNKKVHVIEVAIKKTTAKCKAKGFEVTALLKTLSPRTTRLQARGGG